MSGLELLRKLHDDGHRLPSIMITGNSDVPMAVEAMKAGALDFIEKPIGREELIASIERALELSQDSSKLQEWRESAATHLAGLTPRQREVMERVLAGQPSKNIAADLGISQRTVENHRAVDHEENRIEVASRAGPVGARRGGRRPSQQKRRKTDALPLARIPRPRTMGEPRSEHDEERRVTRRKLRDTQGEFARESRAPNGSSERASRWRKRRRTNGRSSRAFPRPRPSPCERNSARTRSSRNRSILSSILRSISGRRCHGCSRR